MPLKMGSTAYPRQIPGSVPDLWSLIPGVEPTSVHFINSPEESFGLFRAVVSLERAQSSWPASIKLDGVMGVGLHLYL